MVDLREPLWVQPQYLLTYAGWAQALTRVAAIALGNEEL